MKITFHAAALDESAEILQAYGSEGETLCNRFNSEFDRAISVIAAAPDRWPVDENGLR
jgi:hypothetical protein